MSVKQDSVVPMWFAPREGFSAVCVCYFGVSFATAPTNIVRAEFIPCKGRPHQLRKTLGAMGAMSKAVPVASARNDIGRRLATVKFIGNRLSAKAMQSGSLVEQRS